MTHTTNGIHTIAMVTTLWWWVSAGCLQYAGCLQTKRREGFCQEPTHYCNQWYHNTSTRNHTAKDRHTIQTTSWNVRRTSLPENRVEAEMARTGSNFLLGSTRLRFFSVARHDSLIMFGASKITGGEAVEAYFMILPNTGRGGDWGKKLKIWGRQICPGTFRIRV